MSQLDLHGIVSATAFHHKGDEFTGPFSTVVLTDRYGFVVKLFVTEAQAKAIAAAFTPATCCDLCGEAGEVRVYREEMLCAPCFAANDPENSFTDFPLAEEAA